MADKYVKSTGSNTAPYDTWAKAATTIKTAAEAAAAGETVWVDSAYSQTIVADETITFAASNVRIVSTNDTTNAPPTTYAKGAQFNTTTAGADVIFAGAFIYALHGIVFNMGDGTDACLVIVANTNGARASVCDCDFNITGTGAAGGVSIVGNATNFTYFERCSFSWAATGQGFSTAGYIVFLDCDMSAGSTHPSVLFEILGTGSMAECIGCDFSDIDTIFETGPNFSGANVLRQCSLKSGYTLQSLAVNFGEVVAYDCAIAADDQHIVMHHVNYYGSTFISKGASAIYVSDNIADANLSWLIAGTANASKAAPYYSPWLSVYNTGTSAITPYLECVRSGSSTAYNEDQVWVEVTAKTAGSGSTRVDLYSNRSDPVTTGVANTSSSLGASDWTGENATSWFGKLALNASITPAEPGYISARVGVAGEYTIYVDPQLRGLS